MDPHLEEPAAWEPAGSFPHLAPEEVHVWRCSLAQPPEALHRLEALLTPDERDRAARFRFAEHRHGWIAARGLLRTLLGRYLRMEPAAVQLQYGEHGKPALEVEELQFNLSHSGDRVLYAFTRERRVGVDVEQFRPRLSRMEIAERFFSPTEVAALRALPEADREAGFFNCWTRKEAYIKALGTGLSAPLRDFDVTLSPGEPARLLATRPDPAAAARWWLADLPMEPGWAAVVAVEGPGARLRCRDGAGVLVGRADTPR